MKSVIQLVNACAVSVIVRMRRLTNVYERLRSCKLANVLKNDNALLSFPEFTGNARLALQYPFFCGHTRAHS